MSISFYLLNQSDDVDVWVVDRRGQHGGHAGHAGPSCPAGATRCGSSSPGTDARRTAPWRPDGVYYVQGPPGPSGAHGDHLRQLGADPLPGDHDAAQARGHARHAAARSTPPGPRRCASISPATAAAWPRSSIYRLDRRTRRPSLVKSFITGGHSAVWNGLIRKQPAAPGTYLIGLEVTDLACNTGRFPPTLSPLPPDARRRSGHGPPRSGS